MGKRKGAIKEGESVSAIKRPKDGAISSFNVRPTWSFSRADCAYTKWGLHHTNKLFEEVITKLKDLEGMNWNEIMQASGGRSHGTNSHFEDVSALIPEAQKRWQKLGLEEYDQVFSLRLTGTHRLYGILSDGVLSIIWYDQNHEIYRVAK